MSKVPQSYIFNPPTPHGPTIEWGSQPDQDCVWVQEYRNGNSSCIVWAGWAKERHGMYMMLESNKHGAGCWPPEAESRGDIKVFKKPAEDELILNNSTGM